MKTLRIISMIVLVLITLFFVVYAQIQTNLAAEKKAEAMLNLKEAAKQKQVALDAAARADEEAANARMAQLEAERAMKELEKCRNK